MAVVYLWLGLEVCALVLIGGFLWAMQLGAMLRREGVEGNGNHRDVYGERRLRLRRVSPKLAECYIYR